MNPENPDEVFQPEFWERQKVNRDLAARLDEDARVERMPRMTTRAARESRPMTDEERQVSIANFQKFLKRDGAPSQTKLAKMSGVSPGVLSNLLHGSYPGDVDQVVSRIESAIDHYLAREDVPGLPHFVKTRLATKIFTIIKTVARHRSMGAFYCTSGVGKSMALQATVKLDFPSAILIQCHIGTATPLKLGRAILREFHGGASIAEGIRDKGDVFNAIIRRLHGSSRLILLDESDCLTLDSLSFIRYLHDASGEGDDCCPIVLCGRPNLRAKINRTTQCDEIGGSLRGRLLIERNLMADFVQPGDSGGQWLFSVDEVCQILAKYKLTFHRDAAEWLTMLAIVSALDGRSEQGGLRYAIKVFAIAAQGARGEAITVELCQRANLETRERDYALMMAGQVDSMIKRARQSARATVAAG